MKEDEFPSGYNPSSWYDRLLLDMSKAGLFLISADYLPNDDSVTLEIANGDYRSWPDAISVAIRLSDLHLPKNFRSLDLIINEEGYKMHTLQTLRPSNLHNASAEVFTNQLDILLPRNIKQPFRKTNFVKWKIPIDVGIQNRVQLMDPDEPLRYQLYAQLSSTVPLPNDFTVRSSYSINIVNNFDTIVRESDSVLPRVRSEMKKYYQQGESGIESLYLAYQKSLNHNSFIRLEAGILGKCFLELEEKFYFLLKNLDLQWAHPYTGQKKRL